MSRNGIGIGIKVFSFDVDGTLVSQRFADAVWLRGIPEAYATKEGLSFELAYEFVKFEYDRIGDHRIEWYRIDYWLRKFGLEITQEELFKRYKGTVKIYDDVAKVLEMLNEKGYELIISTNAATEFVEFQTQPIRKFFSHVFSATSDFGEVKKSNIFYAHVCEILNVKPQAVVHTGDHWVFDFINPREIGINAYFLDRAGNAKIDVKKVEEFVITDLSELLDVFDCV
ncbi:MAG: HAD family hydrolase [Halobacteriota archaeon]